MSISTYLIAANVIDNQSHLHVEHMVNVLGHPNVTLLQKIITELSFNKLGPKRNHVATWGVSHLVLVQTSAMSVACQDELGHSVHPYETLFLPHLPW